MASPSRFAYYDRLSAEEKATYRKSDEVTRLDVPDAAALAPLVQALGRALAEGKRKRVEVATTAFSDALLAQLGAPRVKVTVRRVRPRLADGELHGLYTYADDDEGTEPQIEVWMRTLAKGNVVRFRTFFRTFVHELLHHLDLTILALDDSFHTEGFFKRESSLVRQLLPERSPARRATRQEATPAAPEVEPPRPKQLTLF